MKGNLSRREAIQKTAAWSGAALAAAGWGAPGSLAEEVKSPAARFIFCLNTATIRGQKLGLAGEIEIASRAGYQAIEPWIDTIQAYVKAGGSLKEIRRRLADAGLTVESAIGFPQWLVDDNNDNIAKGMEQAKREMDLVAQLGGKRLAAPPAGATDLPKLDFFKKAERYRQLLEIGDQAGVVPQLELWGFSKNLGHLGECAGVAVETGHPEACLLLDVFHLYKSGSRLAGLRLLGGQAVQVLHMNDYPADPPRERINDSYRTYPGEGVAPLVELLGLLRRMGGDKVLSLELFNRKLWGMNPFQVARTGLEKMKSALSRASKG